MKITHLLSLLCILHLLFNFYILKLECSCIGLLILIVYVSISFPWTEKWGKFLNTKIKI